MEPAKVTGAARSAIGGRRDCREVAHDGSEDWAHLRLPGRVQRTHRLRQEAVALKLLVAGKRGENETAANA